MPQLLPAAAAWAAAAWSSAVTATAVGLTNVGVMAAIGEGATIALAGKIVGTAATLALSAAATAIMRPSVPSTGTTLDFKPDPKAPVRGAMGYTAVGGNKAFQATWGYNRVAMSLGVALSLGPIDAVTQFQADGSAVAFTGAQGEATGFYAKDMWQRTTLGLPGDAALLPPTGFKYGTPGLTGWGSQHAAPQVSFAFWTMLLAKNPEDRDVYTNGVPDPRWIGRWMKVWNPRRDDTYPGGSGPQRRDDWRTWEWSENPYVHALAWYRGHFKLNLDGSIDRTKRIAGIGAPDAALDIPAFVEGMNVADTNQWTISGEWASTDPKAQVAMAMLQAGGGQPINRGAQISVLVNMPRVSTYTYTKADLIGQATIRPLTPRRDRKNTIIPRFKSEANNWEYVAAGEVSDAGYRAEDRDEPRSVEVQYVHVRNAKQAGQLAAYDLVTLREGLTVTLPSKVHLMHVHAGDCITVDEPELAMVGQKFVVMRTTTDYKSATVTLEVRSETDAKHAFALGQVAKAPPSPTLSAVDPKYIAPPLFVDWTVTPKPQVPGGTSQPTIDIVGGSGAGDVSFIIVEYSLDPTGPWTLVHSGPPTLDGRYPATGLAPKSEYWVSIRYGAKNGTVSARLVDGPFPAPDLIAGGLSDDALQDLLDEVDKEIDDKVKDATDLLNDLIDPDALFEGMDDLAEAILKLGRGQTELQRIMETHTRDGGKLVKSIVQVMGGELENAQAAIVEEAYLSLERDLAEGGLRQALALQVNDNRVVAETAISGVVTNLSAEITARQQLGARVGTAEGAITNEATVRATADSVFVQNFSLMGARRGDSSGWILNQSTIDLSGEGTLASVLSGLRATDGSNSSAITTLQTASGNQASQLTTLSNTVGGNTSSITSLFSVTEGLGARWSVRLDGNGRIIGLTADAETRTWVFSGANFAIVDDGNGLSYTPATGRLKIVKGAGKTVLGVSNNIVLWSGSTSVADGDEAAGNGILAIGPGVPGGGIFVGETPNGGGGFHAQPSAGVRIRSQSNAGTATTATVEIDISGATGTVTYEWTTAEPDWVATSPSGKITAFRTTLSAPGEEKRAAFTCYVRDSGTGRAFTLTVNAAAIYTA